MSKSLTNAILESVSSKKRLIEMPEGGDSPMGLLGQVLDTATSLGWSYDEIDYSGNEGGYEFYQYSPAGEDFSFTACYGDKGLSDDEKGAAIIKDITDYADDFDEEEHASMWVDFKRSDHPNRDSAPGLKALVQDAEDIHSMLQSLADELKKINHPMNESYVYNWRDDVEEVEATEENDDIWYSVAENMCEKGENEGYGSDPYEVMSNIISLWKISKRSRLYKYLLKWYGSEEKLMDNVRDVYDTNNAIYFVTGCGYSIFDADLLGGNADGNTAREFDKFVDKEEGLNEGALEPEFSGRKSFYGKAHVTDSDDGCKVLRSYETDIMKIDGSGNITMLCKPEHLTQTTLRHIREFLLQNNIEPLTKKQLVDLINKGKMDESKKLSVRVATNIDWETDGDKDALASLPKEVELPDWVSFDPAAGVDEVADYLSDEYGWLVNSCSVEEKTLDESVKSFEDWKKSPDYWVRLNNNFGADSETDLETHDISEKDLKGLYDEYKKAAKDGKEYTQKDLEDLTEGAKVKLTEAPEDISEEEEEYELVDNAPEEVPADEEMSDAEYEDEAEDDAKDTVKDDIEEPFYATTPEFDELRDILVDLDYRLFLINDNMACIGRLNGPDIEFLTSNNDSVKDDADVSEANDKAEEVEERAEDHEEDSFEYMWIKAPDTFDKFVNQVNVVYLSPEMSEEDKEQYAGIEASHESVMNFLMNELPEELKKEHEKEEPVEEETPEELPAELPSEEIEEPIEEPIEDEEEEEK